MTIYAYTGILLTLGFLLLLQSIIRSTSLIKWTLKTIWIGLVLFLGSWVYSSGVDSENLFGLKIDPLRSLMVVLILFVSGIVHLFSLKYMSGDRLFKPYFKKIGLLTLSTLAFAGSDHVVFLGLFWFLNQLLLSRLMIHKGSWAAAKEGGLLFFKYAIFGSISLWAALVILSLRAGTFSIDQICQNLIFDESRWVPLSLLLILFSALIQSGVWPFHRWLLSSLNSPTPISAFMHAGLVNGGGFLLCLFAPLLFTHPILLNLLVVTGTLSLILGTFWKLLQPNVKKMLACSTLSQMGFMLMQCGLGFFPAAMAHLCWHGLFKGFLFLNSGSAVETKTASEKKLGMIPLFFALISGIWGSFCFAQLVNFSLSFTTEWIFIGFAAIASIHTYLAASRLGIGAGLFCSFIFSSLYGLSFRAIEVLLKPIQILQPQPLDTIHIGSIVFIIASFVGVNFLSKKLENTYFWKALYVRLLNSSQSHPKTITTTRADYQF